MLTSRSIAFLSVVCLVLSGCVTQQQQMATDSPGATSAPPAAAPPQAAPAAAAPPPAAARAARAPTPPPPEPADEQPMTVTRAREQCWMLAENQRSRDLDSRLKFVEKCVADKMK